MSEHSHRVTNAKLLENGILSYLTRLSDDYAEIKPLAKQSGLRLRFMMGTYDRCFTEWSMTNSR
jgi:hypothetical protein